MKQNLKKWLALFLAITMVGTSGIFVNNTSLRASEEDPYTSESELAAAEAEIPVQETAVEETAQAEEPAAVEVAAPVEEAAPAEEPVAAEETVAAEEATPAEEPATDETAAVSTAETASASSTAEATASSEETELTDKEKAEASYTYDNQVYTAETADKSVGVTATLTDAKAVPDQATLRVTPVNSGSAFDAYLAALNAQAEEGKSYTSDNTIMYDVAFLLPKYDDNGKAVAGELVEYEPAAGSVKVKFDFRNDQLKNEIGAENPEDVEVAHLPLTDAAKEKADTTADNTNISQNDVNVENIADSKESVSDNAASVELNSLSIISFSNPDAAEAGIKLKVTINFENSANQTDPNATLPVNQYYLQIRYKNWQTTCVPLNGMDGDTSVNELVNGKIEVWLKGFPKSDGTYADFTVGDEYTLTLIALKKEKGITYRPTGTNIDQNDYDVVSVGDMAPGTTVSLESMPDKKNITANDNEVTITFKSGYSDQKSQKEMIGNEPFGYGIWANEFNQTGDHDIESSFAAGKYQLDKDNYVHPDLSNYPGSIMAGEISGSNLHMNIDDGTESQVTIYTPDANKVIADGATVDTSLTAQQIKDKISTQINTVASTADAMASKTTVKLKKDNQNNVSIDFSGFPENETIYVDADEIAGGQFNDKIRINKYPGQTIVFNINKTNVALRQILVCNDGTGSTYTPIDMGTDKDLLDSVASHIIWNVPGSGAQVSVDNVAGTFIVPRGTFTINITSSSGWIVANKVVAKAEWHNVNRHMPVPASSSITVKKKLEGGTLAADQFSFQLIDNKGNVLQTKKNDASGNVQFDSINYEKEGTYTYTIKEVKDSTDSTITYDDGVITVTVTVGKVGSADNYDYKITGVTYSKAGGVTTEGSNTFVNKKQQKGSLTVNKTFVKNGKTNTEYNDEIKVVISKTQLEEGTDADTNNTKTITIRNGEGSVTFDNLDLGSYYVYEVVDGKVTSKHAGYTVSGNENATTLSTSSLTGTVNLINTYSVTENARYAAARIRGTKKLDDTYGGKTLQAGQFRFELIDKNNNNKVVDSATNDENGNFVFRTRFFDKAGTYSYFVKEVNAEYRINGISYSDTTYPVSITVDEAQNGQLSIAGDPASVKITNKAFVNVTVSKQWKDNDNALGDRPSEITVHVYRGIAGSAPAELDASPIKLNENGWSSTLTNLPVTDENGNAYIYTVKEDAADNYRSEVTYDYSDGQITANLTNTRIGNIDLVANKKLVNAALKDGQFTFALFHKGEPVLDANGNAITAKNTASGTITFINVPYYSDGYTVREVKGTDDHITYDENEYPITVADGAQTGEAPTFTNTYRPIVLRVRKTSKQDGDPLVGSTYALYQKGEDGNDILVESQTSDANGYMYFKNITPGVLYFFKEVSAPAGHTVDPNPTPIFQAGYVDGNVIIYDENGNQMPETDYTLSSIEDATTEVQDKVDTLKTEDHAFSYSDGQITAVADALDANDPNLKEAKLVVKPLSGEEYDENYRTLVLKSGEIKDAILYDVSFVKDGKEVEPSEGNTITVTIQDANGLSTAGTDKDELTGTVKLIHISNGEVSVVGGSVGIANNKVNQMTVSSDSFSVFGSVLLGSTTNMGGNVMLTAHGVADKVTQLNVKKLDKDSLKPVAGAHLQIRYPDGTVVKDEQGNELDWVSTEQVKTFNRALDVNTEYVLHEVSAPDGYKTADDVHFTIDKFGYVTLLSGSDNAEASRDADTETIDSATLALKDAKMSVVETVTKTLFKHTSKEETVQGKDTVKYVSGTIVKSVQTGDTTQIALMIILLAAAGAALAALLAAKKRSSKK